MSVPAAYLTIILIWSTTPLAIQWSSEGDGFLFAVLARMTVGVVLCLLLLKTFKVALPMHRDARRTYVAAGLSVYGAMLCVYWGARYVPSGLIAVLFGLSPIVTGIVAAIGLGERAFTPGKLAGMLLGVAGLALIFGSRLALHEHAWAGIGAVLLAVVLQAISLVWVKRIGGSMPALAVTGGALLLAVPLYAVTWALADGVPPTTLAPRAGWAILYLGVFGSVLGFNLYFYVLKRMQAGQIALITLVTPVCALLLGHFLNGESIQPAVWLGAASICAGLALHQWETLAAAVSARKAE
jgi:drug/metabolite transporter (DMT)-like permease